MLAIAGQTAEPIGPTFCTGPHMRPVSELPEEQASDLKMACTYLLRLLHFPTLNFPKEIFDLTYKI